MDDIFLCVLVVRLNYHLRLVSPFLRRKTVMEPICWRKTWYPQMGKWKWGECLKADMRRGCGGLCLYPPPDQRPIRPVSPDNPCLQLHAQVGEAVIWPENLVGRKESWASKAPEGILIWWRRFHQHRRCPSLGRQQSFGCCEAAWGWNPIKLKPSSMDHTKVQLLKTC